ncbi:hypothetical protein GGR51DRAFT_436068 [Nemania sp. FL0031]|nr:hypothetical protein GGR51DRAFT_436068 [Nemania sp. FL0031]
MDMNTPHSRSSMQAGLEVVPPETGLFPLPTPTHLPQETLPQDPSPSPKEQPADIESRGQQPTPNQTEAQTAGSSHKGRRILGLSIPVFWAVIITLVVVLAAAIGGGVGGGLSAQRKSTSQSNASSGDASNASSSSSSASTPTSASSSATPSPTSSSSSDDSLVPTDGCPGVDGVAYTAYSADGKTVPLRAGGAPQEFKEQCWTNLANTDSTHDILRTYTPTLENCIVVCAEYNKAYLTNLDNDTGVGGGPCVGVTIVKEHAGFCYLKNGTGTNDTMGNPNMYSSAVLINSLDS